MGKNIITTWITLSTKGIKISNFIDCYRKNTNNINIPTEMLIAADSFTERIK